MRKSRIERTNPIVFGTGFARVHVQADLNTGDLTARMAKHQAKPLKPRDIQGLKYLDRLLPLLDELHEVGCQPTRLAIACLHYDQYCVLVVALSLQSRAALVCGLCNKPAL